MRARRCNRCSTVVSHASPSLPPKTLHPHSRTLALRRASAQGPAWMTGVRVSHVDGGNGIHSAPTNVTFAT